MEWAIVLTLLITYLIYFSMGIMTIVFMYTQETVFEFRVVFLVFFISFFNIFCMCGVYYIIKKRREEQLRMQEQERYVIVNIPMNTIQGTMIEQPDGKIDIGT